MKTIHRQAAQAKRQYMGQLPKFWRGKVTPEQQLTCTVIHWDLITRFTTGTATRDDMWDWIETGFTYSQIMRLLSEDGTDFTPEAEQAIADQLAIYGSVIARWNATGRVGFNGTELNIARAAAHVMDGLIDMDRHGIAERAVQWSTAQMQRIRAKVTN